MKLISIQLVWVLLAGCVLAVSAQSAFAQPASGSTAKQVAMTDRGWPRTFTNGATIFSVYQPQIEGWKDNQFEARAAVAVATGQSKQPAYGVVWFAARTEIDKANRLVTMNDFVIRKVSFPTNPEKAAAYITPGRTRA